MDDLLDGLDGDARRARETLLEELRADGVPEEELRAAVREDRLVLLPVERALLAPPQYTLAEVAERADSSVEVVEARLRLAGISVPEDSDTRAFGDDDVEAAKRAEAYLAAGVQLDDARETLRVLGAAMARVAETSRRLFAGTFLEAGLDEEQLGHRFGEQTKRLLPVLSADLDYVLRHHLLDLTRHEAVGIAERQSGHLSESVEMAVAFADIVGFTELGQDVAEGELTDIADRLDELASEVARRPVRLVKTIGDAVMLVSPSAPALLETMLTLIERAGADEGFPALRAGVAHGRAVSRLGDWFGTPVNLAARLTDRARPESVLTTNELRDALGEDADRFRFSEAGLKRMKGFADPVGTLRVRRPDES